jgi:ABC-type glutathione transport system ATPase component
MLTDSQIRTGAPVALRVCNLRKRYVLRKNWYQRTKVNAADGVSFEIPLGKTMALVGSSGSGKSTVARCVTRLERPDAGEVWLGDTNIAQLTACELRPLRSQIQMIFQDPSTAMNPKMSAAETIEEPLLIQNEGTRDDRRSHAAQLMEEVGLSPDWLDRRVTEFSGGQQQRIAIARALTLKPKLLILDEALSGLDLSTQIEIAHLLGDLQTRHSLTYLLISHDLGLVARMANSLAIIAAGRIVEQGPTHEVIDNPQQPETRELVACAHRLTETLARGASV